MACDCFGKRAEYENPWQTDLITAPCEDPCFFCFALLCSPCASYALRRKYYNNDMRQYACCAGKYKLPMECCYCRDTACPDCVLFLEVLLCHPCSIMSTRFAIQDDMELKNTCCDNLFIAMTFILRIGGMCLQAMGCDALGALCNAHADSAFVLMFACLLTQANVQIDLRDEMMASGAADSRAPLMHPPPPPYSPPDYSK